MRTRNAISASGFVLLAASLSQAANIALNVVQVDKGFVLPDYVTNDILVTFDDILRGQQMILELTQGSVFQHAAGSRVPPSGAFFPVFPENEFDTFVSIGGRIRMNTQPILEVGGAVDLQPGAQTKFDSEGINFAWAPGTGIDVPNGTDYFTARITLWNDAMGTFSYFSSTADGTEVLWHGENALQVVNGVIVIPEPATLVLTGLALLGLACFARRR